MKRVIAVLTAVLLLTGALSASATASSSKPPVIFSVARAIPTKSGKFVRISVYAKHVKSVRVRVDDQLARRATRFGTGCGSQRCSKWRIYVARGDDECYDLVIAGRSRGGTIRVPYTVCEPFPDGSV